MDEELYQSIIGLTEKGNELMESGKFEMAVQVFKDALKLIPNPKPEWEASEWVYTAIGDGYYFLGEYKVALENFLEAYKVLQVAENPFVQLRIGQCFYHCDNIEYAKKHLTMAFMIGGDEIFEGESIEFFELVDHNGKA